MSVSVAALTSLCRRWAGPRVFAMGAAFLITSTSPAFANLDEGVKKWREGDYAGAVAQWQRPASSGNRDALFNLGQAYKLGRGVPRDIAKATDYYRKAAAKGHIPAEANLGWVLFQQGKRDEAMPYLTRAARRSDPHSQYLLGIAYFNGDAVRTDWARAYRLLSAASAGGLAQARDALSVMDSRMALTERQKALSVSDDLTPGAQKLTVATNTVQDAVTQTSSANSNAPSQTREQVHPKERAASTHASAPANRGSVSALQSAQATQSGWRIQLGAFSAQNIAYKAWGDLTRRVPSLGRLQPFYETHHHVTRLQAGPFSDRQSAAHLCQQISAAGGACFPVTPTNR